MLKILLRKQLYEINRSFFYDQKNNKSRSKKAVVLLIALYAILMLAILGGMFSMLAAVTCEPMLQANAGWLYFIFFALFGICFGVFGSVFNTYAGLYRSKDNDLLLSMPIPINAIIISRLLSVYLMGLMFSGIITVPAVIVYLIFAPFSFSALLGGIFLILTVSVIVFVLSCLLGWLVAIIGGKLKNKSLAVVLTSLSAIALYYFFYFKLTDIINTLIENVGAIAKSVKGQAYALYLFGTMGEGSLIAVIIYVAAAAVLLAATYFILSRSFLKIATSSDNTPKYTHKASATKCRSVDSALLSKEAKRLLSSPNYILNCCMGSLLLIIVGAALIIKAATVSELCRLLPNGSEGSLYIIAAALLCMLSVMNDTATPSVSLEGKTLWQLQALPIEPWSILRAKLKLQLILTVPPMLFCELCVAAVLKPSLGFAAFIMIFPLLYAVFSAALDLSLGLLMPKLSWTNEIAPIKQSLSVALALFGGWIFSAIIAALYFLLGKYLGVTGYMVLISVLTVVVSMLLLHWLKTKGAKLFSEL